MIKKFLPKTEFSRNVAQVAGGTVIAQFLSRSLALILSRLFTPAEFGIYSVFIGIAGTAAIVATFRYELGVMLPQKEEEAVNVVSLSFIISFFYSLVITLLLFFAGDALLHLIKSPEIASYIPLIGIYVFFFGVAWTLNYWLSRVKRYTELNAGKILQSVGTALFSICLFYFGFHNGGLIIGAICGQVSIGILYLFFFRKDWFRLKQSVEKKEMGNMFRRYIHFLTFNSPHALLNQGQDFIVAAMIKYYFEADAAGHYFTAYMALKLPIGLISSSTGQVFYQRVSELFPDKDAIQNQVRRVYKQLFLISLPIFIPVMVAGPFLFSLVFGKQWYEAGVYAQILAPSLLVNFILAPVVWIGIVLKVQHYAILFGVVDIICRVAGFMIGAYFNSIYIGLICLSVLTSLIYLFGMYWYYHLPKSKIVKGY